MQRWIGCVSAVMVIGLGLFPSLASATFTASSYPATFSGVTWGQDFVLEAGTVECKLNLEGTLTEPSNSVTVIPSYTECKAFGFASATVNMNGCDYVFDSSWNTWSILCPAFKSIVITAGNCEVTIGAQGWLTPFWASNASGGLWLTPETGSLTYNVTKDGFLCPFSGTGPKTGGRYRSVVSIFVSASGKSLSVD